MSEAIRDFAVGHLTFRLEAGTGQVRAIRFRGHEVLRGIYPAVRDAQWQTIAPTIERIAAEASTTHLTVQIDALVASPTVAFDWHATIDAHASGTLRYAWRGRVQHDFHTNRTGLCVLHPAEAAGAFCRIEHTDGSTTSSHLPDAISPYQPFKNLRTFTHAFGDGAEATVEFQGEVFEMEDQRNWTDASFKTYCRPLDWPKPYLLTTDTLVEHVVTLTCHGTPPPAAVHPNPTRVSALSTFLPWPRIGFGLRAPLPVSLRERARRLRPAHVRVETSQANLTSTLAWAHAEAESLGCALDLAVLDATTTPPARESFRACGSVSLYDEVGNRASSDVINAWHAAGFTDLGAGTRNHFAELNRSRPPLDDPHRFTSFGINAQAHAFDDTSLLETLSQHAVVACQACRLGRDRPVSIASITLGPRADSADPRLSTAFGALWTLGSLVQLAAAGGVERVTYFQLHGPDGILREAIDAAPTPLENLFHLLANAERIEHLSLENVPGDSHALAALVLHARSRRMLLIAHFGETGRDVVAPFGVGLIPLAPRSVWQRELTA